MSGELGLWSDAAGGFIAGPCYTEREAQAEREQYLRQGEDADDLSIIPWFDEDEDEDEDEDDE